MRVALWVEIAALATLLAALFWLLRNLAALPRPRRLDELDPAALPHLAVVLPVRDEERDVRPCVESILASPDPRLELVVVDDGSTDATPAILAELAAADPRLTVVRNDVLPAGWMGKNHALHVGFGRTHADWVLFVDVDLRLLPGALERALATAVARDADLTTLLPELVTESFWERVVMPFIVHLILLVFPAKELNDRTHPAASGNGPFMLFKRAAYTRIGGHEAIRGEVIEDLELARRIKQAGLDLCYIQGVELARLRMYRNLPEIWHGWSKNFHAAVGGSFVVGVLAAAYLVATFALPWLLPLAALPFLTWPLGSSPAFGVVAVGLGYVLVALTLRRLLSDQFRLDDSLAHWTPVAAVITAGILVRSTWLKRTGRGVSWKGRTYGTEGQGAV